MVAVGVRGPGGGDQPPGGDVVAVLLPQPGAGRVERGGLLGQFPCPVQVSCLVRLVGRHGRAVRLHAGGVFRSRRRLPGMLAGLFALCGDVGGPAEHGGVMAAGDVPAVAGVCLMRCMGRGPGPLDFRGGGRSSGLAVLFQGPLVCGYRGAAAIAGGPVGVLNLPPDVIGQHVLPAARFARPRPGGAADGRGRPGGMAGAGLGPGRW